MLPRKALQTHGMVWGNPSWLAQDMECAFPGIRLGCFLTCIKNTNRTATQNVSMSQTYGVLR